MTLRRARIYGRRFFARERAQFRCVLADLKSSEIIFFAVAYGEILDVDKESVHRQPEFFAVFFACPERFDDAQ